jgi:uncharacterized membrane protein
MEFHILLTLIGSVIIIAIDSVYLSFNKNFYNNIIDPTVNINIIYAIFAWILIIVSIQLLVLSRDNLTSKKAFLYGTLLGLASYGVYNLTNASMYPNKWNKSIIIGDTAWGMLLTGLMSLILYNVDSKLLTIKSV